MVAADARRIAVDEVERLLQHSEDLKRLPNLCEDYDFKRQATANQLGAAVSSQLETVRTGIEKLAQSERALRNVQENFRTIDDLCQECSALIQHHEKIQLLSTVHVNLRKTLYDVENIAELPQEAAAAEELLQDDSQLLQAYQCLAALEGTASLAQQTLDGIDTLDQQELWKLNVYFDRVKGTMQRFEERIFTLLRDFVSIGQQNPVLLVTVLRIVEMQELVDRQIESSAHGVPTKRYLHRCKREMDTCIQEMFAPLLRSCSALLAADAPPKGSIQPVIDQAQQLVTQLIDTCDNIFPCFPPAYRIADDAGRKFKEMFAAMLASLGQAAASLSSNDILQLFTWIGSYQETCQELALPESCWSFDTGPGTGIALLIDQYVSRTYELLHHWSINIMQADVKAEPRMAEDGRLWTPGCVDFFRTINEQLKVVENHSVGELLLQTAHVAGTVITEFQEAQRAYMRQGLRVDLLCAMVNNNFQSFDDLTELSGHIEQVLADACKGKSLFEQQIAEFLELSKLASQLVARSVFTDSALRQQFTQIGRSSEWSSGMVVDTIMATLEDYLNEYRSYMQPTVAARLSVMCIEDTVTHYLAGLLSGLRTITGQTEAVVQSDIATISSAFEAYAKPEKVAQLLQPLSEIKGLVLADSTDGFVLNYTSLLETCPGLPPEALEPVLSARADVSATEAKEVIAQCKDVFQHALRLASRSVPPPPRVLDFEAVLGCMLQPV